MANKRVCQTKTGERDWRNSTRATSSSTPPPPSQSPPFALVPPIDRPLYLSLSIRQSFNTVFSPRPPGRRDIRPSARLMGREIWCSTQSGLHSTLLTETRRAAFPLNHSVSGSPACGASKRLSYWYIFKKKKSKCLIAFVWSVHVNRNPRPATVTVLRHWPDLCKNIPSRM